MRMPATRPIPSAGSQPARQIPALRRQAPAPLGPDAVAAANRAAVDARAYKTRHAFPVEGRPIRAPMLLLDGWAARVRALPDGRRQLIGFLLPREIVGRCGYQEAAAGGTVAAVTDLRACVLPPSGALPDLDRALAISRTMNEAFLMAQVVRLGRLDPRERSLEPLLERHVRLSLAGLADGAGVVMPLTREMFADALGLTSVHVNRTLRQPRRNGELGWTGRHVAFPDRAALCAQIGGVHPAVTTDTIAGQARAGPGLAKRARLSAPRWGDVRSRLEMVRSRCI